MQSLITFGMGCAFGTTDYSIIVISLACLPPTKPLAIGSRSHANISLRLISCYFFTGASGLTMQRDFSHIIERNFWLCAGMSAMMRSWTLSNSSCFWWQCPSPALSAPSLAFSLWTFCSPLGVISQDNMLFPSFPFSSQIDGSCVKCTLLGGLAQKRCYCTDLHKFHQ